MILGYISNIGAGERGKGNMPLKQRPYLSFFQFEGKREGGATDRSPSFNFLGGHWKLER